MCGVFGTYAPGYEVAQLTALGTTYLGHRGHEAAGLAATDGRQLMHFGGLGEAVEVFKSGIPPEMDQAIAAIGHTRYSTTGSSTSSVNFQPVRVEGPNGELCGGHNGNFPDALRQERKELSASGAKFFTTMDTEVLLQMVAWAPGDTWIERVSHMMKAVKGRGTYTLTLLTRDSLIMARDPHRNRPAAYGRFNGGCLVSSEDSVLRQLRATDIQDLGPGQILIINGDGIRIHQAVEPGPFVRCSFECTYFALTTTKIDGVHVGQCRENQGALLSELCPAPDADVVVGVPDSGTAAAIGYANKSGIPYRPLILRDRQRGQRTFIEPDADIRQKLAELKYMIDPRVAGLVLVLLEDSVVGGLTIGILCEALRYYGVGGIHLRIAQPPLRHDCPFGIDMKTDRRPLFAEGLSDEEAERKLCADFGLLSARYLTVEENALTQGGPRAHICYACTTGEHSLPVASSRDKTVLEVG